VTGPGPIPRAGGTRATLLSLCLLGGIVACSSAPDDPGGLGADDQRQLNAAASMLDSNSIEANALVDHESSPHD
jgi:hypothetical protein